LFSFPSIAECINLEGSELDITGAVSKEVFPGPPNYESISAGDKAETYWFITVQEDICVNDSDIQKINKFQLFFEPSNSSSKVLIEAKSYNINGISFMGVSGHHRTSVLIEVTNVVGI
jgi:hypothetical protein